MEQSKEKTGGKYASREQYVEQAKMITATVNQLHKVIAEHVRKSEHPDQTRNQCMGQLYGLIAALLKETA